MARVLTPGALWEGMALAEMKFSGFTNRGFGSQPGWLICTKPFAPPSWMAEASFANSLML